jgi:hypothetical protein
VREGDGREAADGFLQDREEQCRGGGGGRVADADGGEDGAGGEEARDAAGEGLEGVLSGGGFVRC